MPRSIKKGPFVDLHLMNIDICLKRLKNFVPPQIKDKLAILEDLLEEDKIESVISLQFIEHFRFNLNLKNEQTYIR